LERLLRGEVVRLPGFHDSIGMYQFHELRYDGRHVFFGGSNWRAPLLLADFIRMCRKLEEIEKGEELRVLE
jgi:hypothetical protein